MIRPCVIATFGDYVIRDYCIFVGWMSLVLILTWMWPGWLDESEDYESDLRTERPRG